ncbi:MAG: CapA family protein [Chlorobi bacterium]|nr:CapA family protein [Chlorobiota bacterium]
MYKIFLIFFFQFLFYSTYSQEDTIFLDNNNLINRIDSSFIKVDSAKINSVNDTLKNTMSLLFIGDVMGHGPQIRSAYNYKTKTYNYDTVFYYLKDIMSEPDFTIANLELTLAGPVYKGYPQFSSPDALAEAGKKAGIDVFVTANNHCVDRRLQGLKRTIDVLDTLHILHTGTFKNKDARDTTNLVILEKDSIKVGILNYTYGTNGIPVPKPAVVNLLDTAIIHKDIQFAKKDSLDKLILVLHFGKEYQSYPNKFQKDLVADLFNSGADIIIGSHPHVIQKMIYLPANDSVKEKFVAYSLGNFVSNQRKLKTDGGVMARIVLKKENGKTFIDTSNYILTWVYKKYRTKSLSDYFILPAAKYENNKSFFKSDTDFAKMKLYIKNSRALLNSGNVNVSEMKID